jgi:uncharacterized membrane protein (UPF0127 family)
VRITVRETGRVLAEVADPARSMWTRFKGLMLRGSLAEGQGLVIEPCSSIHMMFMRFAIDAVFYDREGRITKVAGNLRPWLGLAFGGRGSRGVVELPAGAARDVAKGQTLVFED